MYCTQLNLPPIGAYSEVGAYLSEIPQGVDGGLFEGGLIGRRGLNRLFTLYVKWGVQNKIVENFCGKMTKTAQICMKMKKAGKKFGRPGDIF